MVRGSSSSVSSSSADIVTRYLVHDTIAYHEVAAPSALVAAGRNPQRGARDSKQARTARPGDIVELSDKDAAALVARGAVAPLDPPPEKR
jgi:hypothetical protein